MGISERKLFMGNIFRDRFENHMDVSTTDRVDKIDTCSEDDYSDDFEQLCKNSEDKFQSPISSVTTDTLSPLKKDNIHSKNISKESSISCDIKSGIIFSGTANANFDYGEGGKKQYFIQDAAFLKQKNNLIPIGHEKCTFNPRTDFYKATIQGSGKSKDNSFLIHLDNRIFTKEEIEELDASTPTNLNQNNAPSISELTTDEINYLDENTPETSAIPSTSFDSNGKLQPDYRHPLGDQEDSNGFNHPDAWSNPTDLKDGDIYYQLIPNFKDKHETKSSYFTDKETIDSCRDQNGDIVLSALMQKLQKFPNTETIFDSDGNEHSEYVTEYTIIQYKYKSNPQL